MDSNSENKKILVMGGLGLVSCVVIFVSVVSQLLNNNTLNNLGGKELSFGQANYSQEILASTTPSILDSLGDNTNWQQSVNEFVYEDTEVYSFDNIESESSSSSENTEMVNEQSSLDLFNQFSDYYSSAEESESIVVPVLVEVTEMNYPSLSKVKFDDCGILVIPSGPSLALFAFTAGEEPAVVCLGEAVAKRCHDSKTEVQRDGSSDGFVYVVERADGVCSVGLSTGSTGAVSLCSIEKIMNSDISKKKSIKEWQLLFKSDPGDTFASMYFDNSSKLSDPALASQFDCQTFKFAE